ncbi:phosphoribosyltransferase, partial [Halobacteriales archaeon QH_10_67_13]
MDEPPETFDCTVTDWAHVYELSRAVSEAVRDAEFEPDVIVALARGGWIAGRICCDFLGIDDLVSLKIEHYVGTAQKGEEPRIRYPLSEATVGGKDV